MCKCGIRRLRLLICVDGFCLRGLKNVMMLSCFFFAGLIVLLSCFFEYLSFTDFVCEPEC